MTDKRDYSREEVSTYKIGKGNLEKTLLEKKLPMKAMKWSVVDLESTLNCLATEKCL